MELKRTVFTKLSERGRDWTESRVYFGLLCDVPFRDRHVFVYQVGGQVTEECYVRIDQIVNKTLEYVLRFGEKDIVGSGS